MNTVDYVDQHLADGVLPFLAPHVALLIDAYRAMARRDWATRVLDEGRPWTVRPDLFGIFEGFEVCRINTYVVERDPVVGRGPTRDAARLAAAESVFPTLPADVRATLGERP